MYDPRIIYDKNNLLTCVLTYFGFLCRYPDTFKKNVLVTNVQKKGEFEIV